MYFVSMDRATGAAEGCHADWDTNLCFVGKYII